MLSVGTISAGTGYQYLTEEVATGAEDYYVRGVEEIGERPGVWMGSGAELLDLEGVVRPEQMALMYGQGMHPAATPDNPVPLGPAFPVYKTIPDRLAEARAANPGVDAEEWERIEHRIRKGGERTAVAGFDLTFSPPKSWSVLWAAAPDEEAREKVWAAHHEGVRAALEYLEAEACFSRVGHNGVRQVDADGFVAAAFDHRQSRDGDPQMHTHVAVLNRVRCTKDGVWRTLDSGEVFAAAAAAGGMYDLARETALERSLGVVHEFRRPDDEVREIEGISDEVIAKFSSRRRAVEARLAPMLDAYEERHGHPATPFVRARLSEFATLETRPAKGHGETVGDALARWEARERGFGNVGLAKHWEAALDQRHTVDGVDMSLGDVVLAAQDKLTVGDDDGTLGPLENRVRLTLRDAGVKRSEAARLAEFGVDRAAHDGSLDMRGPFELAERAVARVADRKATWTRADLTRQVERLARREPNRPAAEQDLKGRVDRLVDLALRPGGGAVALTAPPLVEAPEQLRRASDGRSEHQRHLAVRYAAGEALMAEGRLVATARTQGAPVVSPGTIDVQVDRRGLGVDQAAAARHVLASGRRLDVVVGPAGTGKTHTTAAIAAAWQTDVGPVLGLALSQNAAQVLADASGNRAENITKWLLENARGTPGWQVAPGQLVIVDEAGMVPTAQLDRVVGTVAAAGGKVLLVGDPEQLAAPGAGGAMRLVVADVGAAHLDEVRRFGSPWEGPASLRLRAGDPDALVDYDRRARITGGTVEEMQEAAYQGWLADSLSGKASLLMAATNEQAAELVSRARVDLVRAGRVTEDGLVLADGNRAGVGDRIVTRSNDRRLGERGGMVANRDEWTVQAVGADGSLQVRRYDDPKRAGVHELPAAYVAEHVQLAYASTVHGAQGRTVDTAHSLLTERSGRDGLYVGLTRGREGNWAYVVCERNPGPDEERGAGDPVATLAQVLANDEPALAATQVLRDEHDRAESLHTLYPQWKDTLDEHARTRWAAAVETAGPTVGQRIVESPAWPTLVARLETVDAAGVDAEEAVAEAIGERELAGAIDPAAVVHWRLEKAMRQVDQVDQVAEQPAVAAGLDRASFVDATPDQAPSAEVQALVGYARQLAEQMDQRVEALAERALADPPPWAAHLGPVPEDPAARLEWAERAGTVAAYQEITGGADDNPIGARPGPAQPDARARWEAARHALHGPPIDAPLISDEDLHAVVDRAAQLTAESPDVVLDQLRQAHEDARAAQTAGGLAELNGPAVLEHDAQPGGDVAEALAEAARLEQQHQQRQDWLAEHGPDVAAGDPAAAELARRAAERAARPFVDLNDDQLGLESFHAAHDLASVDRRIEGRTEVIRGWETQAAHLDDQAVEVERTHPRFTQVQADRRAEEQAAARLAHIEDRLDRGVLRGGPRAEERGRLQAESAQLRWAHRDLANGTDRAPVWEQRTETAWATDKTTVDQLRDQATDLRCRADAATASLPRLAESRATAVQRLDQLADEHRRRKDEPARPAAGRVASAFPEPINKALEPTSRARDDSPTVDPSQPSPAQRGIGGRPGPHLGR